MVRLEQMEGRFRAMGFTSGPTGKMKIMGARFTAVSLGEVGRISSGAINRIRVLFINKIIYPDSGFVKCYSGTFMRGR
jgi:hypothetical protein